MPPQGQDTRVQKETYSGKPKISRLGSTVYISNLVPVDEFGAVVGPGEIVSQVKQVFENLRQALLLVEASLDDLVWMTSYTTNALYYPTLMEAFHRFLSKQPAHTFVVAHSMSSPHFLLELEVAVSINVPKQEFPVPGVPVDGASAVAAVQAGNTLYVSGQVALDSSGNVVGRGSIEAQSVQVCNNIQHILEAAGASVADIVQTTTYMTNVMYRPAVNHARQQFGLTRAANTSVVIQSLASPDFLLEISAIAVVREEKQTVLPADVHASGGNYAHGIVAGSTIYVAGQVGFDQDSRIVGRGEPVAQAIQAFDNLRRVLGAAGASFHDIAKLTTYVTNSDYLSAMDKVKRDLNLASLADISVVVSNLALPELLLEIDAIASVPSSGRDASNM